MVCVLPVPGGPNSSRPRLRCWPAASSCAVFGDAERMTLDPREHRFGQYDVVCVVRWIAANDNLKPIWVACTSIS